MSKYAKLSIQGPAEGLLVYVLHNANRGESRVFGWALDAQRAYQSAVVANGGPEGLSLVRRPWRDGDKLRRGSWAAPGGFAEARDRAEESWQDIPPA